MIARMSAVSIGDVAGAEMPYLLVPKTNTVRELKA